MKMSFWSHCQGLVVRLRQGRTEGSRRFRRSPLRLVERLEARTLVRAVKLYLDKRLDVYWGVVKEV